VAPHFSQDITVLLICFVSLRLLVYNSFLMEQKALQHLCGGTCGSVTKEWPQRMVCDGKGRMETLQTRPEHIPDIPKMMLYYLL
jgi:hypothetical protein